MAIQQRRPCGTTLRVGFEVAVLNSSSRLTTRASCHIGATANRRMIPEIAARTTRNRQRRYLAAGLRRRAVPLETHQRRLTWGLRTDAGDVGARARPLERRYWRREGWKRRHAGQKLADVVRRVDTEFGRLIYEPSRVSGRVSQSVGYAAFLPSGVKNTQVRHRRRHCG